MRTRKVKWKSRRKREKIERGRGGVGGGGSKGPGGVRRRGTVKESRDGALACVPAWDTVMMELMMKIEEE